MILHTHASTNYDLRERLMVAHIAFPSRAPMWRRIYTIKAEKPLPRMSNLMDKLVQPFIDLGPSNFVRTLLKTNDRHTQWRKHLHARQIARQRQQFGLQKTKARTRLDRLRKWFVNAAA